MNTKFHQNRRGKDLECTFFWVICHGMTHYTKNNLLAKTGHKRDISLVVIVYLLVSLWLLVLNWMSLENHQRAIVHCWLFFWVGYRLHYNSPTLCLLQYTVEKGA